MLVVDWIIVAIIAISALISIKRGFVKEMLSLASWILAFTVARIFSGQFETLLIDWIQTPSARSGTAFVLLFVTTLVIGAMINHLVAEMIRATGLSGTDRLFGVVFGMARGLVLITGAVFILQMTAVSQDPWWTNSALIPHFEMMVDWSKGVLPSAAETILTLGQE